ncbi:lysophospholipid acyltransferase family protein [Roseimaritima sediminicola]|uniref:lysophospholipid acyltransferase family protein n=1 Tax=Roseimaritima sediminicola TaxID=2662066 RepID=UPI0012982F0B|nr:lipid A biosynthesis acyltransferase [Roseimaritima sediminicola]
MRQRLQHLLEYLAVRLVIAVMQTLPEATADGFCRGGAWLLSDLLNVRGRTVDDNLRRVFPDHGDSRRAEIRRQMWHHLLLMLCEIAWAPRRLHRCNWKQHLRIDEAAEMLRWLLSPRPLVVVSGHYGNFEIGGYITGLMGISSLSIARNLDNPYLHRYITGFRAANGQRMVDKNGCAPEVDRHLSAGGVLTLLADQHGGERGCWVDFLGHPASCHKGLALFSLTSQAPMMVAYTRRCDGPMRFDQGLHGVVDPADGTETTGGVRPLTAWYNDRLGEVVMRAPEQYWWLHRRWRPKPQRVRKKPAAVRAA